MEDPTAERFRTAADLRDLMPGFEALFEAAPSPFLVVTVPDFRIIAVNDAYLAATMTERAAIVGRTLFDVFPDNPDDPSVQGVRKLRESLERVITHRRLDKMEVTHYDIPLPAALGGGFEQRWWQPRNAPVLAPNGEVMCIIHHVEDATAAVRAEAAQRDIESRRAFLLKLSDAVRPLGDVGEIEATASRVLGEHLGVNRVFYAEVQGDDWQAVTAYEQGVEPQAIGRHPLAQFDSWIVERLRSGKRLEIRDLRADARFEPSQRAAFEAYHIVGAVAVPVIKPGALIAALVVHSSTPRYWSEHELSLIEETAERTRAAVEQAKTAAVVRESEERYRMLFESIDQGFCTIEVLFDENGTAVDYRFLQRNPSFDRQTGIESAVGRRMREIAPQHEEYWFEAYGRVAQTGEPEHFTREAAQLGRWYDVYAFRVGEPRLRRVGILFNDITARKRTEDALRSSLADREALLKELHHRVKNNLQVITSLLEMQGRKTADTLALTSLSEARSRIAAIATIHELLYQSGSFSDVDLGAYARRLIKYVASLYDPEARITAAVSGEDIRLDLARSVPFGLLLNELVSNAYKHAFRAGSRGELRIALEKHSGSLHLRVSDTGVGLPTGLNERVPTTLGLQLVRMLAKQLGGSVTFNSSSGTSVEVSVPLQEQAG